MVKKMVSVVMVLSMVLSLMAGLYVQAQEPDVLKEEMFTEVLYEMDLSEVSTLEEAQITPLAGSWNIVKGTEGNLCLKSNDIKASLQIGEEDWQDYKVELVYKQVQDEAVPLVSPKDNASQYNLLRVSVGLRNVDGMSAGKWSKFIFANPKRYNSSGYFEEYYYDGNTKARFSTAGKADEDDYRIERNILQTITVSNYNNADNIKFAAGLNDTVPYSENVNVYSGGSKENSKGKLGLLFENAVQGYSAEETQYAVEVYGIKVLGRAASEPTAIPTAPATTAPAVTPTAPANQDYILDLSDADAGTALEELGLTAPSGIWTVEEENGEAYLKSNDLTASLMVTNLSAKDCTIDLEYLQKSDLDDSALHYSGNDTNNYMLKNTLYARSGNVLNQGNTFYKWIFTNPGQYSGKSFQGYGGSSVISDNGTLYESTAAESKIQANKRQHITASLKDKNENNTAVGVSLNDVFTMDTSHYHSGVSAEGTVGMEFKAVLGSDYTDIGYEIRIYSISVHKGQPPTASPTATATSSPTASPSTAPQMQEVFPYQGILYRADFENCADFAQTGLIGANSEVFEEASGNPWRLEKIGEETILTANMTKEAPKAYLMIGEEDWEDYDIQIRYQFKPNQPETGTNRMSLYTRSIGNVHTWKGEGSYYRFQFNNPAAYGNYFAFWTKNGANGVAEAIDNGFIDKTEAARLDYDKIHTLKASVYNELLEDGQIRVHTNFNVDGTYEKESTRFPGADSPLLKGKIVLEFCATADGGTVQIYDIQVTGSKKGYVSYLNEQGQPAEGLISGKPITVKGDMDACILDGMVYENPIIITAVYQDGILYDCVIQKIGKEGTFEFDVQIPQEIETCEVNTFIWSGLESMRPVTGKISLGSVDAPQAFTDLGMHISTDGKVSLKENLSQLGAPADSMVTALILKPGAVLEGLDTAEKPEILLCGIGQTKVDETGDFLFWYQIDPQEENCYGEYQGYVKADGAAVKRYTVSYEDPDILAELIKMFNTESYQDLERVKDFIEANAKSLGLDLECLSQVKRTDSIFEALRDHRPYPVKTPMDNQRMQEVFAEAVLCQRFNEAWGEDLLELINNPEYFDLEQMDAYDIYTSLGNGDKIKLMEVFEAIKPVKESEFVTEYLDQQLLLFIITGKDYTWQGLEAVLEKYADRLDLDFSDYNRLTSTQKKNVITALQKALEEMDNPDEIPDAFDGLVDACGSKGGGGGGGSNSRPGSAAGGGSSGGTKVPGGGLILNGADSSQAAEAPVDVLISDVFSDLKGYEWAKDSIEYLAEKGIVEGDGRLFSPGEALTREQFVKMLVNAFDILDPEASCTFQDVKETDWSYPYIASAVKAGLVNGINGTEFGTGRYITRQDMIVIADRFVQYSGQALEAVQEPVIFADEAFFAVYAQESIERMQKAGIVEGSGDGYFYPENSAARAEAAVMVERLIKAIDAGEEKEAQ